MMHRAELSRAWDQARRRESLDPIAPLEQAMLHDVVDARPLGAYGLAITFEDGVQGEIDVAMLVPFDGVFAPLRSEAEFARVFVNRELGSVSWPCGADLDTHVIYARIHAGQEDKQAPAAS